MSRSHYPPEVEKVMRDLFESLPERHRRRYAAVEAARLGRGGLAYLAGVLGCDEKTIRRGRRELSDPAAFPPGRSRKKGAAAAGSPRFSPACGPPSPPYSNTTPPATRCGPACCGPTCRSAASAPT